MYGAVTTLTAPLLYAAHLGLKHGEDTNQSLAVHLSTGWRARGAQTAVCRVFFFKWCIIFPHVSMHIHWAREKKIMFLLTLSKRVQIYLVLMSAYYLQCSENSLSGLTYSRAGAIIHGCSVNKPSISCSNIPPPATDDASDLLWALS